MTLYVSDLKTNKNFLTTLTCRADCVRWSVSGGFSVTDMTHNRINGAVRRLVFPPKNA